MVYTFEKSGNKLHLLVDYYRNELVFLYKERELKEDFDNALDKMKKLTNGLIK